MLVALHGWVNPMPGTRSVACVEHPSPSILRVHLAEHWNGYFSRMHSSKGADRAHEPSPPCGRSRTQAAPRWAMPAVGATDGGRTHRRGIWLSPQRSAPAYRRALPATGLAEQRSAKHGSQCPTLVAPTPIGAARCGRRSSRTSRGRRRRAGSRPSTGRSPDPG